MSRLKLEGPGPCTIFGFRSYSMHVLQNEGFLLVSFSIRSKQLLCFMHGQPKKANKNIQQNTLSDFISIPIY